MSAGMTRGRDRGGKEIEFGVTSRPFKSTMSHFNSPWKPSTASQAFLSNTEEKSSPWKPLSATQQLSFFFFWIL